MSATSTQPPVSLALLLRHTRWAESVSVMQPSLVRWPEVAHAGSCWPLSTQERAAARSVHNAHILRILLDMAKEVILPSAPLLPGACERGKPVDRYDRGQRPGTLNQ